MAARMCREFVLAARSTAEVQGDDDIDDHGHFAPQVEHVDDSQGDAGEADEDQHKEDETAQDQPGRCAAAFFAHGVGVVVVALRVILR